jgi:hypothetical protein
MNKSTANVKAPDVEKDRDLLVKELRRDLQDLIDDSSVGIDRLAELARVIEVVKKKSHKK